MKFCNILSFFLTLCIFASCAKVQQSRANVANVGEAAVCNGPLSCSMEEIASDSRTAVRDAVITWTGNETILINDGANNSLWKATASASGKCNLNKISGTCSGPSSYCAVYPGEVAGAQAGAGTYLTTIPAIQTYSAEGSISDGALPMVGVCDSEGVIRFKNAAGILKFTPRMYDVPDDEVTITSIILTANENISGDVSISYTPGGTPATSVISGGSTSLKLTCPSIKAGVPVYFVLPPGEYTGVKAKLSYRHPSKSTELSSTVPVGNTHNYTATGGSLVIERSAVTSYGVVRFFPTSMSDVTNLASAQSANCYVVTESSKWYSFNLGTRGNGVGTLGSESSFHNLSSGFDPADIKYIYVYYQCGDGVFEVEPLISVEGDKLIFKTAGNLGLGSALVAVCNEEWEGCNPKNIMNALWSWHIWAVPGGVPEQTIGEYTFMDRNIGARSAGFNNDLDDELGNGFFYQWGRKDPFMAKYTPTVEYDRIDMPTTLKAGTASFGYDTFWSYSNQSYGTLAKTVSHPNKFFGGGWSSTSYDYNYDWMAETLKKNKKHTGISYFDWWSTGETSTATAAVLYGRTKAEDTDIHKKTMFDPCPPGYRVPTVRALYNLYNGRSRTISGSTIIIDGIVGIPVCGVRRPGVENLAKYGYIWSANGVQGTVTVNGTATTVDNFAHVMYNNSTGDVGIQPQIRGYGFPVRCMKDE